MKKIAAVLALTLMVGVSAQAGTIQFTAMDGLEAYASSDLGNTSLRFQVGYLDDFFKREISLFNLFLKRMALVVGHHNK